MSGDSIQRGPGRENASMTRWRSGQVSEGPMRGLRDELARRQAGRARRRVWLRWRRRRLMLALIVVERELADATDDRITELHQQAANRITERLGRNATRLFR
jgi:hypothetical protein